jgi:hypothetical protein
MAMAVKKLMKLKEFCAAGLYEEPNRSLFYRKALGLRRFYEYCDLPEYHRGLLYPSGKVLSPCYISGLAVDMEKIEKNLPKSAPRRGIRRIA